MPFRTLLVSATRAEADTLNKIPGIRNTPEGISFGTNEIIPLITEYFEERIWGKAIAVHESAASIAMFSSPFIALLILSFLPWRGIFGIFAVLFVVCIA
jgi:hypothetical protein